MNTVRKTRQVASRFLGVLFASLLVYSASAARLVEETFPVLKTRTGTYTNVTVTTKADTYIFILHTNGMTNIKIGDLPYNVQQQLGYAPSGNPEDYDSSGSAVVSAQEAGQTNSQAMAHQRAVALAWMMSHFPKGASSEVLLTVCIVLLALHIFYSYCCRLICLKATGEVSSLIWLPVLQLIPLFNAAGMSGAWLLAVFVPGLNLIAYILWCFNIVKARGKHVIWAILLLLPFASILAFFYLAFSGSDSAEAPPEKFQTQSLQTA